MKREDCKKGGRNLAVDCFEYEFPLILGDQTVNNNVTCLASDSYGQYYLGGHTTSELVTDTTSHS